MDEKSEQSRKLVKNYMWWPMGAGLLPIPVAGVAAVTGVQLRMLSKLSGYSLEEAQTLRHLSLGQFIIYHAMFNKANCKLSLHLARTT